MNSRKKLTRSEAITVAQAARRLPEGVISDRVHLQLSPMASAQIRKQTPAYRGAIYELGAVFEDRGYLMIYKILDALGVRIISTILGNPLTIVCQHKTYEGDCQADLLLEILKDRLENF